MSANTYTILIIGYRYHKIVRKICIYKLRVIRKAVSAI